MEKLLRLYTYVDGGINDTPFPNADNPIEIGAFRYDAKRMGGAPTITASVNYASCLDDKWTDNVYAMFNGEKHYLKQIPTSSYNNSSAMYKHDIELVSERVALDNVYFFDVVSDDIVDDDKPVSNSTKVVFFGDVREFANRLKASLQYSALDYDVVVDTNVVSEEKLISFEDQFFSNVLQEIYNTYEVPYYFEGKTIHIGYSKPNEELPSFAYGVDDALLSISKNNANYKVVNRATGTGSSENIPFYYPNNSPKGNIRAELNTASDDFSIEAVDLPTFSNKIDLEGVIEAKMVSLSVSSFMLNDEEYTLNYMPQAHITVNSYQIYRDNVAFVAYSSSAVKGKFAFTIRLSHGASEYMAKIYVGDKTLDPVSVVDNKINFEIEVNFEKAGNKEILAEVALSYIPQGHSSIRRAYNVVAGSGLGWFYKDKAIDLKDVGIKYQGTPSEGDKITQKLIEYINTSQSLMPSKYRDTKGVERFYNATNDTYEGVTFNNPFVAGKPKEHIVKIEDIKPSIEGMLVNGQRIDMFEAFAYDVDDNDETYEDEDGSVYFKHPYFFAKLKPLGFNLFDHAIEQQPMTISFTSGACGACNFEIAVDEESQKNIVQVTEDGSLVYDENGRVLCGVEGSEQGEVQPQDIQQDTTSHSVWIALRKEEVTYGILMPKAPVNGAGGHRPTTDDTFVILGINLPDEYILNAERRLEEEIIKYLQDNNDEKFTFSIGFSRIYFAENEDVLNSLNENSKIQITYDNKTYDLYVSSFSYTMSEGDALPEIKVELDETLKTSQNAIQKAINEVKTTLGSAINEVSQGVAMQRRSYVSKVQDDTAMGVVDFSKGVKFGEGGKVEILDNNSAKLTIEYLEVTKKATFTSLEIQEKTHVGGQMLVTPASMNCGEVEEFEGFYRCYFQTKGADGSEEIFNQFVVGDQAICQTFNAWGSKYYWRLVVGVGEDYIDLSKEDCDEGSGVPEAGDRIIQMGNREDEARQNAIVIAAHGDNSPYIVQYKGINNFDLPNSEDDERITTLLSPTKNVLTGQVKMIAGSSGLELFEEWAEKQELIDSKASGEDFDKFKSLVDKDIENIKKQVDGAITTWFYDATPTLDNAPAVDWITDDDKNNHLGDLYYSGAGKAYRFQYDEATSAYYWNLITDEDITEALALAQKAQDTADGKRRVFVDTPTPPYDEGDLWSQGPTLPMMICVNGRAEGSIQEGDWDFADNTSQLATQIAGYEYIKEAIQNGSTIVTGGLIQSGVLMLGYTNASGQYQVMSGTNGVYDANATGGGIAAWYGGAMSEDSAKTVLRFDGSGFFANKNITWDNEGGASFAGGKITITKEGALTFSDTIAFGSGGDSVSTVLEKLSTLLSYFTLEGNELSTNYQVRIKNNLIVEKDTSSGGGGGSDTPSGELDEDEVLDIVKGYTYSKSEINKLIDDVNAGDIDLTNYYTKQEVDAKIPSLDGYATETWVTNKNYLSSITKTMVDSVLGSTAAGNANRFLMSTGSTSVWAAISDYALPLSGGTLTGDIATKSFWSGTDSLGLFIEGKSNVGIRIQYNKSKTGNDYDQLILKNGVISWNNKTLIHSGNYATEIGDYYLKSSGGTISGRLDIDSSSKSDNPLFIRSNATDANGACRIAFYDASNAFQGYVMTGWGNLVLAHRSWKQIGVGDSGIWCSTDNGTTKNTLIHSGNIGSYAFVPKSDNLISNVNADNYLSNGAYLNQTGNGGGNSNFPQGYAMFLTFSNGSPNYVTQLDLGRGNAYYRTKIDTWSDWKQFITSDNIGSQNAGSADVLASSYANQSINFGKEGKVRMIFGSASNAKDLGYPLQYTSGLSVVTSYTGWQMVTYGGTIEPNPYFRKLVDDGTWSAWKKLAFLDDNVASATKLQTARTIWGQSFDGTGNVSGLISSYSPTGSNAGMDAKNDSYSMFFGVGTGVNRGIYDRTNGGWLLYRDSTLNVLFPNGNVLIGTTTDLGYKLDVNGTAKANAFRASVVCIECDSSGNTSGYGGEINRLGGGQLWIQAREGGLQLGNAASTTNFNGAVTMSSTLSVGGNISAGPNLFMNSTGEGIYLTSDSVYWHKAGSYSSALLAFAASEIIAIKPLRPANNNSYTLGTSSYQWSTIYGVNGIFSGDTSSGSDIRFKDVIKNKTIKIADIAKAPLFTFKWNDREDDSIHLGSSAQYWEKVCPWLVTGEDFKSLNYATLGVAMGISLAKKAVNHEARIKELEKEIKRLKEEMRYGS